MRKPGLRVHVTPPKPHSEYKAEWGLDTDLLTSQASPFSTRLIATIIIIVPDKREQWYPVWLMLS